ncbi:amidohydrolase family protein [Bifidobacterium reuteri]|nr:amidohydrolase family protein [Bifidobacterium reuteri]
MNTIIRSRHIFDGNGEEPFQGFIEFRGPFITRVEHGWDYGPIDSSTHLIEHDDHLVMPGLHDNHVFFSGWMAANAGLDLSHAVSMEDAASVISDWASTHPGRPVYAHGWNRKAWGSDPDRQTLDAISTTVPIAAIDDARSRYWMNNAAIERYGFQEDQLSAETRVRLIREMCHDAELVRESWQRFERLLLSRGVVSCKDIVFDDCDVHVPIADKLLDVTMTIEPVAHKLDKALIPRLRYRSFGPRTRFGGVKIMVDGVVADGTGDIRGTYTNGAVPPKVYYDAIEADVAYLSDRGVSCCLTAEGDKAIERSAEILARHTNQQVRHSISDLEMITGHAAKIMAEAGITAEIYPQILGLNPSLQESYMPTAIVGEDGSSFFHYTNLTDHNVTVTSGTDCPLFVADVPEALLRASRRRFDQGEERWFPEYALTQSSLLKSWIRGGDSRPSGTLNGKPSGDFLPGSGTGRILQRGATATFAIFDRDLLSTPDNELHNAQVIETIIDGKTAYRA